MFHSNKTLETILSDIGFKIKKKKKDKVIYFGRVSYGRIIRLEVVFKVYKKIPNNGSKEIPDNEALFSNPVLRNYLYLRGALTENNIKFKPDKRLEKVILSTNDYINKE